VKEGLQAKERIVVNGLQRIRPGALVAPQPVEMSAKAELAKPEKPLQVAAKS
ncbi:MAG: efflux transporter periplasmic adaptor subunit, partial [Telluria sp.]